MKQARLNIVGCGRLARAIARLFFDAGLVGEIHIRNRSLASGYDAANAITAGVAHLNVRDMPPSSLWLVGCGDQDIQEVVQLLKREAQFDPSSIVFHCSGVLSSEELAPLRERGCSVASVHPVRSFASSEMVARDFSGTLCGGEGDERALAVVGDLFSRVGGEVFSISTEAKMVCHAGHVFASNYLVAILKIARDLYAAAGIPDDISMRLMEPLVRGTVDNVMKLGPTAALTGPIARGEGEIVARQLQELSAISPNAAGTYAQLGRVALEIARGQGVAEDRIRSVEASLNPRNGGVIGSPVECSRKIVGR